MCVILATALMIVEVFAQLGSLNSAQRLPPRDVRCPLTDWGSRRLPGGTMVLPSMQTFFILVLFFGGSKEKNWIGSDSDRGPWSPNRQMALFVSTPKNNHRFGGFRWL